MFGFLKKNAGEGAAARPPRRTTSRTDWETLNREIYSRVIEGGKFCIGVVSMGDSQPGQLKSRMSNEFPGTDVVQFIRTKFRPEQFERIMNSHDGLAINKKYGLFIVASDKLGLPLNSMVVPITSRRDPKLKSLLIFGGQFLDSQMAARMSALDSLLGSGERSANDKKVGAGGRTQGELMELLKKTDIKRLFEYDVDTLAEIANGLEEIKERLPQQLKPRYGAINSYLMKKQLNK